MVSFADVLIRGSLDLVICKALLVGGKEEKHHTQTTAILEVLGVLVVHFFAIICVGPRR